MDNLLVLAALASCLASGWHTLAVAQTQPTTLLVLTPKGEGTWQPLAHTEVVFFLNMPDSARRQVRVWTTQDGVATLPPGAGNDTRVEFAIQVYGQSPCTGIVSTGCTDTVRLQGNGLLIPEVVVTAQLAPTLAHRSTYSVRVIDRQRIDKQAAVNLADLLSNELNIRLQRDNVLGTALTMQGLGGQNVKILVDGVPIVGRLNGNLDLGQINLNDIERIEMIEGPMAVSFGTDALGGVINLITRRANNIGWGAGVSGFYESVGYTNADSYVSYRSSKTQVRLSGGRNFFAGWNPSSQANPGRTFQWKPREQLIGSVSARWQASPHIVLTYRGQGLHEVVLSRGPARVTPTAAYAFDDRFTTIRTGQDISMKANMRKGHTLDVLVAGQWFSRQLGTTRRDLTTLVDSPVLGAEGHDTNNHTLTMSRGTLSRMIADRKLNYLLGYEASLEWATGDRIANSRQQQQDYAAFTSWEYTPSRRVFIRPGVRAMYNTAYRSPIVPSLHIKWEAAPNLQARASYARGFRAPSLRELHLYFVDVNHNLRGNPNLRAEYSHSFNVQLAWQLIQSAGVWKAEAAGYFNDVHNLISLAVVDASQLLYTYVNIGRVQTLGVRAEASLRTQRMGVVVGGQYAGSGTPEARSKGVPTFAWSPEARLNADWQVPVADVRIALFYKYTGPVQAYQVDDAGGAYRTHISGFQTVDITATRHFWKQRVRLTIGIRNLANVQNVASTVAGVGAHSSSSGSIPQGTGRAAILNLSIAY